MRSVDIELVKSIKKNVDLLLEQQKHSDLQRHEEARELPMELHGLLVEMADLDKEENTTLIDLVIALLYARENRTHEESLVLLEDMSNALTSLLNTPIDE